MIPFLPDEVEVLRVLARSWPSAKTVVLGAAAIRCFMPMRWRVTQDLDLTIAAGIEDSTSVLASIPGWSPDPRHEQRWLTAAGVAVDVVPASTDSLERGYIEWPRTRFRMSLVGMRLAFERDISLSIASDLEVRVAPLYVLTVLKMVAFLERPDAREKDVGDLAHILHGYIGVDSDRRFSSEVPDDLTEFDDVAPYLLGCDVAAVVNPQERQKVLEFIDTIEHDTLGPRLVGRMSVLGPSAWRDPDGVFKRISAFRRGLGERSAP